MSAGRFIVNVIAVYVTYAVIGILFEMGFTEQMSDMAAFMRSKDDPQLAFMFVGHLIETVAIVILWSYGFASASLKCGAKFGALIGLFLVGVDVSLYGGMPVSATWAVFASLQVTLMSVAAGVVLAKLHKPESEAGTTA